jgi:hypothetical protein
MDYDEPHLTSNEKTQPIQWTERQLVHWWLLIHSGWQSRPSPQHNQSIK